MCVGKGNKIQAVLARWGECTYTQKNVLEDRHLLLVRRRKGEGYKIKSEESKSQIPIDWGFAKLDKRCVALGETSRADERLIGFCR